MATITDITDEGNTFRFVSDDGTERDVKKTLIQTFLLLEDLDTLTIVKLSGTRSIELHFPSITTPAAPTTIEELRDWFLDRFVDPFGLLTNKGEIIVFDGAQPRAFLGADGEYLYWDSGEPSGLNTGVFATDVLATLLTGLTIPTASAIVATDNILEAFGKIQAQINTLLSGLSYQGTWNATTNTPTLTSSLGTQNHYYVVSVAGSTNLDGITDWEVGDWAIYNGTRWQKLDFSNLVSSVAGKTGAVTLNSTDITDWTTAVETTLTAYTIEVDEGAAATDIADGDTIEEALSKLQNQIDALGGGTLEYEEFYTQITGFSSGSWQTATISAAPANAIVDLVFHNWNTTSEQYVGVREFSSSIDRRFEIPEAESGGYESLTMRVKLDGSKRCKVYKGSSVYLYLIGVLSVV